MAPVIFYDLSPAPGTCPYAQRAWIAFVELGIPFETKFIDKANKGDEFLSLFRGIVQDPAGKGTVPTIIDGDYKLTESAVVVEYLDKKYGKPGKTLLPDDAEQLGKVKLFGEVWSSQFTPNLFKLLKADTKASLAEAQQSFSSALQVLNNFIKVNGVSEGGDYFLGSRYSYAETLTTPFLVRAVTVLPSIGKFDILQTVKSNGLDRLGAWIEASLSRPSAKSTGCGDELILSTIGGFNSPLKD